MSNRYCATCGHDHGPLYICEHYPAELQEEILRADHQWRKNLMDPAWCQKQIDNGLPPEGIVIFRALAGVPVTERASES